MIIGSGQNAVAASLARAGTYPRVKLASTAGEGSVQPTETLGGTSRKDDVALQVGFGDNTLSGPGAALRTIGGGLESARRSVPTLEQIRAQQVAALAQDRIAVAQRVASQRADTQPEAPPTEKASAAVSSAIETTKASPTTPVGLQAADTEKTSPAIATGNEPLAMYSRRPEASQDVFTQSTAPKLDVKA